MDSYFNLKYLKEEFEHYFYQNTLVIRANDDSPSEYIYILTCVQTNGYEVLKRETLAEDEYWKAVGHTIQRHWSDYYQSNKEETYFEVFFTNIPESAFQ